MSPQFYIFLGFANVSSVLYFNIWTLLLGFVMSPHFYILSFEPLSCKCLLSFKFYLLDPFFGRATPSNSVALNMSNLILKQGVIQYFYVSSNKSPQDLQLAFNSSHFLFWICHIRFSKQGGMLSVANLLSLQRDEIFVYICTRLAACIDFFIFLFWICHIRFWIRFQ